MTPSQVVKKTFSLPEGGGDVQVLVTLNDKVIHSQKHSAAEGSFSVTFEITEASTLRVYYDSELQYELTVSPL